MLWSPDYNNNIWNVMNSPLYCVWNDSFLCGVILCFREALGDVVERVPVTNIQEM